MDVRLLGRVTLVSLVHSLNAPPPMEATGRLLIVAGMINTPVALGLLPVIVMALPLLVPLLIGDVRATGASLNLEVGAAPWTLLLAVAALWSAALSVLLFPIAVER